MSLPNQITAGDTLDGTGSFADYPASAGWILSFRIINKDNNYTFTASANGTDYVVSVPFGITAKWQPGLYDYQATVSNGSKRFTVETGRISILPNLMDINSGGFDGRSTARKILDGLNEAYQNAVTNRAFVFEYQIAGRMMRFHHKAEWILELNYWKAQVAKEERAAKLAKGAGGSSKVFVRM